MLFILYPYTLKLSLKFLSQQRQDTSVSYFSTFNVFIVVQKPTALCSPWHIYCKIVSHRFQDCQIWPGLLHVSSNNGLALKGKITFLLEMQFWHNVASCFPSLEEVFICFLHLSPILLCEWKSKLLISLCVCNNFLHQDLE